MLEKEAKGMVVAFPSLSQSGALHITVALSITQPLF